MIHELKTDPDVFDAVKQGLKTFEIRKDDRGFAVGDTLVLHRTLYTGAEMASDSDLTLIYCDDTPLHVVVSHILRGPVYGLQDGWVVMSFAALARTPAEAAGAVAWMREWEGDISDAEHYLFAAHEDEKDDNPNWIPLYAAPAPSHAEQASKPVAYMTENDYGDMLFFDLEEARKYCDDDVEPIALCRCASLPSVQTPYNKQDRIKQLNGEIESLLAEDALPSVPVSDERILELARKSGIKPIRGAINNCEWLCVTPDLLEFARAIERAVLTGEKA